MNEILQWIFIIGIWGWAIALWYSLRNLGKK